MDAVETIFGQGEIISNPIQNVRIKPPESILPQDKSHIGLNYGLIAPTPWHQDVSACTEDVRDSCENTLVTVWFPLHDVD
jgi:hypothetical protein